MQVMLSIFQTYENTADYKTKKFQTHGERACGLAEPTFGGSTRQEQEHVCISVV